MLSSIVPLLANSPEGEAQAAMRNMADAREGTNGVEAQMHKVLEG